MHRSSPFTVVTPCALLALIVASVGITQPVSAEVLLADFTSTTGIFTPTNEVTSATLNNGELTVVTPGAPNGFKNILHDSFLPRTGASTPNVELTATDLLANPFLQWSWRSDDAGSTGDFIGNHIVFNHNVSGTNNYRVLQDSFRFIPPNENTSGTHTYDIRTDPAGLAELQNYINGAGSYFQIFIVQQTNDNTAQATVHYNEFRAVPEPSVAMTACGAAAALGLARRRRVR